MKLLQNNDIYCYYKNIITNFMDHDLAIIVMRNLFFIGLYGIDINVFHLSILFEH
jgi:hypothetical protein